MFHSKLEGPVNGCSIIQHNGGPRGNLTSVSNTDLRGLYHAVSFILLILLTTLPYALLNLTLTKKLIVNVQITFPCPFSFPSIISNVKNNKKNELFKTVGLTSFQKPTIVIRVNLLQVCPSVRIIVFTMSLIPSFHVLRRYFHVSLTLVAAPAVRILMKFVT